jgi:arginine-tRNA-protein transferase
MSEKDQKLSQLDIYGEGRAPCGYCHSKEYTCSSFGLVASFLTCEDYQQLIEYNWRRAGNYCYINNNQKTCCPSYSIRLNVQKFKPSKSQIRIEKLWKRYLNGENVENAEEKKTKHKDLKPYLTDIDGHAAHLYQALVSILPFLFCTLPFPETLSSIPTIISSIEKSCRIYPFDEKTNNKSSNSSKYDYFTNLALRIAALLRKEKIGISTSDIANLIIEKLNENNIDAFYGENGFVNFIVPHSKPSLYHSVINNNDNAPPRKKSSDEDDSLIKRKLEITQEPATFNQEAYQLYCKYEMNVHKKPASDLSEKRYTKFLCNSPLEQKGIYGSFHQHYRIDGRLVAVGVIDILPKGLSAVYLFYDPAYQFLNLGTFTALKEIEFVHKLQQTTNPELTYWFGGYYIHSCQKMRYKAKFGPSELLCPLRYTWHPLSDKICNALDQAKFVIFSNIEPESSDEKAIGSLVQQPRKTKTDVNLANSSVLQQFSVKMSRIYMSVIIKTKTHPITKKCILFQPNYPLLYHVLFFYL